jgi:hypothetical protein
MKKKLLKAALISPPISDLNFYHPKLDFMPKSSLKNGMYRTDLIFTKINN